MPAMLETAAALAVTAAMFGSTVAALAGATRVGAAATHLADQLFLERQLEHLIDRAALAAGSGPTRPPAIAAADAHRVVFHADLDGDGRVQPTGAETTALELATTGSDLRVRHRLGRQTMTVLELERTRGEVLARDIFGEPAAPSSASLLELRLRTLAGSGRSLHFCIPATLAR